MSSEKYTNYEFGNKKDNNIILLEPYQNNYDNHKFKCLICNHEWDGRPIRVKTYSKCPECQKSYMTSPYSDNIKDRYFVRTRIKKMAAVMYKGCGCQDCGLDLLTNIHASEFHHLDPSTKDFELNKLHTKSIQDVMAELDKCILLCSNCHRKRHFDTDLYNQYYDKIQTDANILLDSMKNLS